MTGRYKPLQCGFAMGAARVRARGENALRGPAASYSAHQKGPHRGPRCSERVTCNHNVKAAGLDSPQVDVLGLNSRQDDRLPSLHLAPSVLFRLWWNPITLNPTPTNSNHFRGLN